jgi:hypothetical protein
MAGEASEVRNPEVAQAIAAGMPECPNCHGRNVRLSHTSSLLDRLVGIVNYVPFRCRVCQARFYKRTRIAPDIRE